MSFLNKKKIIKNFNQCLSWENRYLYLIELGKCLSKFPKKFYKKENQILGCQSQVWMLVKKQKNGKISFYGDSDSSIVKGLLMIIFTFYDNMKADEIINFDIFFWIKKLELIENLTISRSQGLESIINNLVIKVKNIK